jgi:protein TonB
MDQPLHDVRTNVRHTPNSRRAFAFVIVGIIHAGLIYALAVGLATGVIQKGVEEIKVAVEHPKIEKAPPPPPPDLAKPPPPVVPPPEIVIQQPAPVTQPTIVTKPIEHPVLSSSPVGIGRPHYCSPQKYYTESAVRLKEQGTTTLSFTVTAAGDVENPAVAKSSGFPDLDQAAIQCASGWRYKAAIANGQSVAVSNYQANIQWTLPK